MVNDAYEVERGNTGVAFKNSNRIHFDNVIEDPIAEGCVVKAMRGSECVGCVVWSEDADSLYFGPLAIMTGCQGKGIGRKLIVEGLCRQKQKLLLKMCVVNHRTDLIPMYEHLGFVQTGDTKPYYEPNYLTRESWFVFFEKIIK